jgi:D-alanyl-D-alanine dipeptidase
VEKLTEITLMSDARVTDIPVADAGEPFVDLRDHPELVVDGRLADPAGAYAQVRAGVAERLLKAQSLLSNGLRLLVVEAYRPPVLQRRYFDDYSEELAQRNPGRPPSWVYEQASRFVAPLHVAPHVAGAAVDLTLSGPDGTELPMGTEVNASPEESGGNCFTAAPGIPATARRNRALLSEVLTAAGLVNYPTEWWHWSYGDKYWALCTGAPAALHRQHDLIPIQEDANHA